MIPRSKLNGLDLCLRKKEGVKQKQARVPAWVIRKLDRDGVHFGKTWRQIPGDTIVLKACNWWLWKRGLITFREARAEADAVAELELELEERRAD